MKNYLYYHLNRFQGLYCQFALILILSLLSIKTIAQEIATDSKGKGVFTTYSLKKYRFDFSQKDFSFTYSTDPDSIKWHIFNKPDYNTVLKKRAWFFQLGLLNATNIISLSDTKNFRPGFTARVGRQTVVDAIYPHWKGQTFAWGVNAFASVDNIKLFDKGTNTIGKRYPFTYGLETNYLQYWGESLDWLLTAANVSITNGWNDTGLLNYKELSSATLQSNVVAFDKFDGKFGEIEKDIWKARFSLSAPMNLGRFNPIPYAVLVATTANKPSYFTGVYANFLYEKTEFRPLKMPSSFGLGMDWNYTDGKWSSANVFVRGSIAFGEFK